jgi:hypothetical protein
MMIIADKHGATYRVEVYQTKGLDIWRAFGPASEPIALLFFHRAHDCPVRLFVDEPHRLRGIMRALLALLYEASPWDTTSPYPFPTGDAGTVMVAKFWATPPQR